MKKIFFYYTILLLFNFCFSQDKKTIHIEYVVYTYADIEKDKNDTFSKTLTESKPMLYNLNIYDTIAFYKLSEKVNLDSENEMSIKFRKIISSYSDLIVMNLTNGNVLERVNFKDQSFCISTNYNHTKWQILKDTKLINGYNCYKAIFEQENLDKSGEKTIKLITVYFCPELPYKIGPDGYNGLPGLILELQDSSRVIRLNKIIFDSKVSNINIDNERCEKDFSSRLEFEKFKNEERKKY